MIAMNYKSQSLYYRLARITPIAVFILMMLGSYVKAIGAGLSCPDWPLCYNQLFPGNVSSSFTFQQIMAEYIHRIVASLVSILLVLLLALSYVHKNEKPSEEIAKKRYKIMVWVIILLVIQVTFGALTVLLRLEPFVVSVHLGVATLIFGGTIFHTSWINKPVTK